jgi:hypothetical protein
MKTLKIQSLTASLFSVIFSLSIAKQLIGIVSGWILILLIIFVTLFLLYNEDRKIKELRRQARGRNFNWVTIIFTLFISISMSSIGIYLWTNQTFLKTISNDEKQQVSISLIESDYNVKIDQLRSSSINTEEYLQVQKDIEWWKGRRPADLIERAARNNQIAILQERLSDILFSYSEQKNNQLTLLENEKNQKIIEVTTSYNSVSKKLSFDNYISFIFIFLVLVTEFIIINIQREIGRYYNETDSVELKIIRDLLNQGMSEITIDDIKYSKFNKFEGDSDKVFKQCKKLFNLLLTLEILVDKVDGEKGIKAKFIEKKKAVKKLRNYYFKLNNLKK